MGALLFATATEPDAVAAATDDFLALEASGWKGKARTAAAGSGEVRGFVKAAVTALAAEGKVAINRVFLDGRPIAAAITLRSGDTAWLWKAAYDEALARYSPGVMLAASLTEELADERLAGAGRLLRHGGSSRHEPHLERASRALRSDDRRAARRAVRARPAAGDDAQHGAHRRRARSPPVRALRHR